MGVLAKSIWSHNDLQFHGSILDASLGAPYLISSVGPVVHDFDYVISDAQYGASRFERTLLYNPRSKVATGPPSFPCFLDLGIGSEWYRYDAGIASSLSEALAHCETLVTAAVPSDYAVSGHLLNAYEVALGTLQEAAKELEQEFDLNAWAARVRQEAGTTGFSGLKKFKFQEILDTIEIAQITAFIPQRVQVLTHLLFERRARKLRKRVWERVQLIKRILRRIGSRFCGLSWSRRFWFLLHGCHPPKTEAWPLTCQSFGCA